MDIYLRKWSYINASCAIPRPWYVIWASYGVPFLKNWGTIDRVITAPHCTRNVPTVRAFMCSLWRSPACINPYHPGLLAYGGIDHIHRPKMTIYTTPKQGTNECIITGRGKEFWNHWRIDCLFMSWFRLTRKHQNTHYWFFVMRIYRWPVVSPHEGL